MQKISVRLLYIKRVMSVLTYNHFVVVLSFGQLHFDRTSQIWSNEKAGAKCRVDDVETLPASADRRTSDRHDSVDRPE